jgi:2-amino-4-hydroxy-6-hydroxymethyldihydropteridine diphosphokinase
VCLDVERERGRLRDERWGPRTLDLDILLFGDREIDAPGLVVPHPRLRERAFVLVPLAEVARYWRVPGTGQSVDELLLRTTGREGVRVWRSSATRPPT